MPSAGPFSCTNTPPELVATRWPVDGANSARMPVSRTEAASRNAAMTTTTKSSRTSRVLVTQRRILAITKPHKVTWYSDRTGNLDSSRQSTERDLPEVKIPGMVGAGLEPVLNDAFPMAARLIVVGRFRDDGFRRDRRISEANAL